MRLSVFIALVAALVLIAAGCGSSGGTSSGEGTNAGSGSTASTSGEGEAGKGEGEEEGKGEGEAEAKGESEEEGPVVNEEASGGGEEGKEGGEGEGKEGEAKPSSEKAALIKSGDEICRKIPERYATKLAALEKKSGKKKLSKKETNLKVAVPPLYMAIEEFEEVKAPSGEEEQLEAIVAALEAAAEGLEEKPGSKLSGPKSPFAEFQKLTQEYGFKVCSQI